MSNDSDQLAYFIGYEIQHIFVSQIGERKTAAAIIADDFLKSIGFNLDARGNQIALLRSPETRDAVLGVPGTQY